jgi:formylmethanofuran dehydrogenase subunit E
VPSEADRQSKSANLEHLAFSTEDLACLLEKARDLHGHLGPFLVVGVRAGLRGLRELQTRKESLDVSAKVRLKYTVPYSCILDGVQVATGCTIGNRRLTYENSPNPMIVFRNRAGRAVTVSILPQAIDELMRQLAKDAPAEEAAYKAAAMAEEELFEVARSNGRTCLRPS